MNNIGDYLSKRASELGMGRADQLAQIQAYFDGIYPGMCRAMAINEGILRVSVNSASLATELRMRHLEVHKALAGFDIKRIIIQA